MNNLAYIENRIRILERRETTRFVALKASGIKKIYFFQRRV